MFQILLFILNPITGIIFSYSQLKRLSNEIITDNNEKKLYLFSVLCIALISLVNAAKVPDSDLVWYLDSFRTAYGKTLSEYWPISGRYGAEPLTDIAYLLWTWFISNISFRSPAFFVFINTFVVYSVYCLSVFNFAKYLQLRIGNVIVALSIACFFPFIFTSSANILRQFDSTCFFMYAVSLRLSYDGIRLFLKKAWIPILLALLFHKSALFLVVLLCAWPLGRKYSGGNYLMYVLMVSAIVFYQILATKILPFVGGGFGLAIAVERATHDTYVELQEFTSVELLIIFTILATMLFWTIKKNISEGLRHTINICLLLAIFVLINQQQLELSRRFYMNLLFFVPIAYMLICKSMPKLSSLNTFLFISLIAVWYVYTKISLWTYDIPIDLLVSPIFFYNYNILC